MGFWSQQNSFEPLRQHRWYIDFGAYSGLQEYVYALKECSKPSYKIDVMEHTLINHTFRFPKNLVWQPITAKMAVVRDDKGSTLSKVFHDLVKASGYALPRFGRQQQISKVNQSAVLGSIQIYQLDSNGNKIEGWSLYNPIISDVNYGSLSYSSEEIVEISFTITYDYADMNSNNSTPETGEIKPGFPDKPIVDTSSAQQSRADTDESDPANQNSFYNKTEATTDQTSEVETVGDASEQTA